MLIAIFLSVVLSGYTYILSGNIYYAILIFGIATLLHFLIMTKIIRPALAKIKIFEDSSAFIHSFAINLSNYQVVSEVLANRLVIFSKEVNSFLDKYQDLDDQRKLNELNGYFNSKEYHIFMVLLEIYSNNGGEVFQIFDRLLEVLSVKTELLIDFKQKSIGLFLNNIILWLLSFTILILCRYMVQDLYIILFSQTVFLIPLTMILGFFYTVVYIYLKRQFDLGFIYEKN